MWPETTHTAIVRDQAERYLQQMSFGMFSGTISTTISAVLLRGSNNEGSQANTGRSRQWTKITATPTGMRHMSY